MASLKQQNREQSDIDHHVKDGDKRNLSSSSLVMLKKPKLEQFDSIVPAGFLALASSSGKQEIMGNTDSPIIPILLMCNGATYVTVDVLKNQRDGSVMLLVEVGMDHVRVHPKFLHLNATSHMWAFGAFADLLDNSLNEICNGATYVNVDVLKNHRDSSVMLLVEGT
ncbi:hypothetical protein GH714_004625 [Hevea brasiliensis]|uniref:Protein MICRORCHIDIA 6 n=1 Tax=Hevea brasiliensis TaxID=3981 RepID=A0A6A6N1G1_HEVBR|nr:hypothetical protein GH714_004625 [Hevea brasiliensis]